MKVFQYESVVIEDRGHYTPSFLLALNDQGSSGGEINCPRCGCKDDGHAVADGWKLKEQQPMGSTKIVCLLEREVVISGACR